MLKGNNLLPILSYKLEPEDLEKRFRLEMLHHDKSLMVLVSVVTLLFIFGFIIIDYFYLPKGSSHLISLSSRLIIFVLFLLLSFLFYRQSKVKNYDRIVFLLAVIHILHLMVASFVRPGDHTSIVLWDVITILFIYTVVPIPLKLQIIPSLFLAVIISIIWL